MTFKRRLHKQMSADVHDKRSGRQGKKSPKRGYVNGFMRRKIIPNEV